ncbi:MAG: HD domain-containing protein [Acidimicrobiia bacterium]|nr:HD domain-containing protein [Acidimicrobiia bacterium]
MNIELDAHGLRTARLAVDIGDRLGIRGRELRALWVAAHLHDIGKVELPSSILDVPRALTCDERVRVEEHPTLGYALLHDVVAPSVAEAVLCHHERIDGSGYPNGLSGDAIPRLAKIIAVADAVDAIVSQRCYKPALSLDFALFELDMHAGTQFDPVVVEVATSVLTPSTASAVA